MILKKYITASILFFLAGASADVRAQGNRLDFLTMARGGVGTSMVTDYHSIGINPANLGLGDFRFAFGLAEANVAFYSDALTRQDLNNFITNPTGEGLGVDSQRDLAKKYAEGGVAADVN